MTAEVLGRSLDELPPQTRRLLVSVDLMVRAECQRQRIDRTEFRFSRRDARAHTGWGDTQLRVHLQRLEELEYLLAHRGGRGQSFVYELVWAIEADGKPVLPGLIDVAKLEEQRYDDNLAGLEGRVAGSKRVHIGGARRGRGARKPQHPCGFRRPFRVKR